MATMAIVTPLGRPPVLAVRVVVVLVVVVELLDVGTGADAVVEGPEWQAASAVAANTSTVGRANER